MNPNCPDCGHPYSGHTSEGCWHHDLGVICGCMVLPPPGTPGTRKPLNTFELAMKLMDQNQELTRKVAELEEKLAKRRAVDVSIPEVLERLRVQTARAERLDKENDERFTRETEYQNRIRMLEQKLRDVASYAMRDLT